MKHCRMRSWLDGLQLTVEPVAMLTSELQVPFNKSMILLHKRIQVGLDATQQLRRDLYHRRTKPQTA